MSADAIGRSDDLRSIIHAGALELVPSEVATGELADLASQEELRSLETTPWGEARSKTP